MTLDAGSRLGPYEILSAIGAGGMGDVYRARDTKLGRDVALKILQAAFTHDADRLARFQREAQVLASLNHPNVAAIYGLEESGGVTALVLELVDGPTLADRITQGPIPIEEALPVARQIAEALEAAHEQGIIHRDLKPANIKVRPDTTVKVLDFGLAKALEPAGGSKSAASLANSPTITSPATMTGVGVILGTAAYMSPEQAKGRPADKRSDIWAFGCVLAEMLTGKRVFGGSDLSEVLASVIKDEPRLGAVPRQVRAVVERCLRKDPRKRWQAIGDVRIALDEEPATEVGPSARRTPLAWIAATAVCFSAASVLAVLHFRETPPEQPMVRFEIPTPDVAGPSGVTNFQRLSPDGRHVVYVDGSSGSPRLVLRSFDAASSRLLAGTEDASYPFWSPDSRSIGYFAQQKLKRITLAGEVVQTICDAPNGRGGTWNGDDVILFAPDALSGIYRVAAKGGTPAQVTKPASPEESHRLPEFLPDGRSFLYGVPPGPGLGIWVASLDGPAPVRVLPQVDAFATYRPSGSQAPGHLLFLDMQSSTVMAQAFDTVHLRLEGEPFSLGFRAAPGVGGLSVSAVGTLAYWPRTEQQDRELVWLDRTGKRIAAIGQPGQLELSAVSPDGNRVALVQQSSTGRQIYLRDATTGVESRLTVTSGVRPSGDRSGFDKPVWSADSQTIFFAINPPRGFTFFQRSPNATGPEETVLVGTRPNGTLDDVSPDGRYLLYSQTSEKGTDDLWVLPLQGTRTPAAVIETPAIEQQGQFSPDGHWLAYMSSESSRQEIYVTAFPPRGPKYKVSVAGGSEPRWRHDGRELFYLATDRSLMALPVRTGSSFDPGTPQALFRKAPFIAVARSISYQPSHDGQRFLGVVSAGGDVASMRPLAIVLNWRPLPAK